MAISIVEIGDKQLDDQHDNLLLWFCRLERALFEDAGEHILDELLDELRGYVEEHFACEERVMALIGYPGLDAHRAEHDVFRQRLEAFLQARLEGGPPLGESLLGFLKQWIVDHINRADAGIALYLDPALSPSLKRLPRRSF